MDSSSFCTAAHPRALMGRYRDFAKRFARCVLLFPLQGGQSWCLLKYAGKRLVIWHGSF